jgi:preprotein translocase subunit SecG
MEAILLVVHVVIALALIGVVLIQRSDQDGFGMGSSGSGANFMTGRQSASFLTRTTAVLAAAFMLNSLVLTILAANRSDISIVDRIEAAQDAPLAPKVSVEDAAADAFGADEDVPEAPAAEEVIPDAPSASID